MGLYVYIEVRFWVCVCVCVCVCKSRLDLGLCMYVRSCECWQLSYHLLLLHVLGL